MNKTKTVQVDIDEIFISLYLSAYDSTSQLQITLREFFDGIRIGTWMDHTMHTRSAETQEQYDERKKASKGVTLGGAFTHRDANPLHLIAPSGFMGIDLDHLDDDRAAVKDTLIADKYVYAVWDSIGGKGLSVLFRVDPDRWLESFMGIQDYLAKEYGLFSPFDRGIKDKCRLRFVSYDPDIRVKDDVPPIFKLYPAKKEQNQKKAPQMAFVDTDEDFRYVFDQVTNSGVDITPEYHQRRDICFAIISKFGSGGWDYFNRICYNHAQYDLTKTERMWKSCLGYGAQQITIKTFYYYCKLAGLDIMTSKTREIVHVAAAHKRTHSDAASAVKHLKEMGGFDPAETEPIVRQVFESKDSFAVDENVFDDMEMFLKKNYNLRYNEVRRVFEDERERSIEDADIYQMYIHTRKILGDRVKYPDFHMLVHSHIVFPKIHPIKAFFANNREIKPTGLIDELIATIETDTGWSGGEFSPTYAATYIRKWLIGIISTVFGEPCPLVLVLTGPPNTGKTQWFRRLLPVELQSYRDESKWLDKQDDELKLCTHLLSFNDEFNGRDTRSMDHFKSLTSKDYFVVREVYARKHVRLRRLAVMCGTSNPKNVIAEPEFNRRIIPINVLKVHFDAYNAIDKTGLIMEAYHAYMAGERHTLSQEDIAELQGLTEEFHDKTLERQLVEEYLELPSGNGGEHIKQLSCLVIQQRLELHLNNRKLSHKILGREMQAMGFVRYQKRIRGKKLWVYDVIMDDA